VIVGHTEWITSDDWSHIHELGDFCVIFSQVLSVPVLCYHVYWLLWYCAIKLFQRSY